MTRLILIFLSFWCGTTTMCPSEADIQVFAGFRTAHSADGGAWKKRSSGGWLRWSWQRELSLLRGTVGLIRATPQQSCGANAIGQWSIAFCEDSSGGGRSAPVDVDTIRVLQLNIWKSFNGIEGGAEALADEIAFHRPDIVSLNEIVTSVANPVHDNILATLERRGLKYYLSRVQECDVLSVAPLTEISRCYPDREEGRGAVMVAHTVIRGHRLAVYSAHLDYLDDAYYNIRGIDGSTWKPCPVPSSVGEVLERNDRSWRDEAIGCFLNAARRDMEQGWKVIMCGDFNEPSHLDWTQRTSQMYDHHGFVVPWTCTTMLERGGFADAYRAVYADETVYPGFTFPAWCESVDVKQLAWAPDSDERDRIDYVFYHAGSGMKAVGAALVGPEEMVCRSAKAPHWSSDRVHRPQGLWPSDHRGVLVEIEINAAGSVGAVNAGRR